MVDVLAVVPARGGSKGIPRKNIRDFAGSPLLAYSIAAGLQAQRVTRVIVSTDDEEIAQVARAWGAETPFLRPAELAQDQTTDLPVFQHALRWLAEQEGYTPDVVVQLRPTSPVRPRGLVDQAVETLLAYPGADSVRGVVSAGQNPHKMWKIDGQGRLVALLSVPGMAEPYNAPRQALPPVYWQTGHIDAVRPRAILEGESMSGRVILPVAVDPAFTVDIDTATDWLRAEWLVQHGGLDMVWPGSRRRPLPDDPALLVMDFDGVLTDNRVWVNGEGEEFVAANRSDSLGINRLRAAGVPALVLSSETDPCVAARCRKMDVPLVQGIHVQRKAERLRQYLRENGYDPARVVFAGNDLNDVECFAEVGCGVAVADALPEVRRRADIVLSRPGGHGAVRELCDRLLEMKQRSETWQKP